MCLLFWDCFCVIQMGLSSLGCVCEQWCKKRKAQRTHSIIHSKAKVQLLQLWYLHRDVSPLSIRHSLCLLWLRFRWVMLSDNSCVFSSSQPKKHGDGCSTSWQVYVPCNGRVLFSPVDSSLWEFSIVYTRVEHLLPEDHPPHFCLGSNLVQRRQLSLRLLHCVMWRVNAVIMCLTKDFFSNYPIKHIMGAKNISRF